MSNVSRDSDVPFAEDQPQPPTPAPLIPPDQQPCPKCHSQMVEGWIPHIIAGANQYVHHTWQPGPPAIKKSKALGFIDMQTIVPPDLTSAVPLIAFRCVRCGFVELYARAVG